MQLQNTLKWHLVRLVFGIDTMSTPIPECPSALVADEEMQSHDHEWDRLWQMEWYCTYQSTFHQQGHCLKGGYKPCRWREVSLLDEI